MVTMMFACCGSWICGEQLPNSERTSALMTHQPEMSKDIHLLPHYIKSQSCGLEKGVQHSHAISENKLLSDLPLTKSGGLSRGYNRKFYPLINDVGSLSPPALQVCPRPIHTRQPASYLPAFLFPSPCLSPSPAVSGAFLVAPSHLPHLTTPNFSILQFSLHTIPYTHSAFYKSLSQHLDKMISHLPPSKADLDREAALTAPSIIQHLLTGNKPIPDWILQLRKERLALTPKVSRRVQKTPSVRAVDCDRWIKKNNYQTGAIRKRKPEARPPKVDMARPANAVQHQRHSLQLISRVLNIRSNASPFTLILDDLNQRAAPLVGELARRALSRNVKVVIVTFESTTFHHAIHGVPAYGNVTGDQILQSIRHAMNDAKESLVIVDSLHDLVNVKNVDMGELFHLVANEYASTLIGVYHQDTIPDQAAHKAYAPQPYDLFKYMAMTVITCKSFAQVLAAKAAKERSLPEPTHGLLQAAEGVVQSLDANDHRGIVFEAEFRRKSGRPESETYFLRPALRSDYNAPLLGMTFGTLRLEFVTLLDQVPAYSSSANMGRVIAAADEIESTFNLALTEKQKQAREGVVLPYFDAQKGEGAGEGGRILYDMGEEDDFDEEEDEI